ncbi:neprilysin-4 isoform X2 [Patella vulgata]|nr:neprilysin-4 isoform X2 [Patella vulgata]
MNNVRVSITKDEYVINNTPHYFERLFAILNATPKRTITNYAIWRSIEVRLYNTPKKFRTIYDKYLDAIYGEYPTPLRYKYCAPRTALTMRKAVSRGFIEEAFDKEAKADVLQMIKTIQSSFNGLLTTNDWMDDDSRKGAKNKSDSLTMKIGYDERLLDDTYLNALYQNSDYNDDTYFWNMVIYTKELHLTALRKLRIQNVVSKDDWYYDPFIVNTYYSAPKNEIEFSAGIIQPPYYHKDFPAFINFAGIGDAIGHELTHSGLDDRGEIKHANGKSTTWWSDEVIDNFKKNALCLTNQYNTYTVPETKIKVNGKRSLTENIADNGGLKLSFQAYRDWVQQRGAEEPMLPGLDLTPNQIFFINYAQSTCEKYTKAGHIANNMYGFHSPARYRVIGTLQNSPEFAKTFGCGVGSYMNPVKKCKLW